MQKNSYEVLNVTPESTNEEITQSYNAFKARFSEERFLEGEKGNYAAKMLTEIEVAYNDIMGQRRESNKSENTGDALREVEEAIKAGDISGAQAKLDNFNERNAEWHYLQSVVFYKKNWINESKKQLELALRLDSSNAKYKDAYDKMEEQIKFNNKAFTSGNSGQGSYSAPAGEGERQMGGDACSDSANCCSTMLCVNCLYNCCCGCR